MSTQIDPVEMYYQAIFKKLLYILPYAVVVILVTQILILMLKHYFIQKLNDIFNSVILLFNCLIEDEEASLLKSEPEMENIQINECKGLRETTNSGTCITVDEKMNSFSNMLVSSKIDDDSASDIEMPREDSDEEKDVDNEKHKLEESIEVKTVLLRNKRQELCGRLLACKLMEFHEDDSTFDDSNSSLYLPLPTFLRNKSKSPIPVAEEIDVHQVPVTPASPLHYPSPFFPEDKESYSFTYEDMLAKAIQASLDDLAAKQVHDSGLTPPRGESSTVKLSGQLSTEAADKDTTVPSPSEVINHHQTTLVNRSPRPISPMVSSLDSWNKNYPQDVDDPVTQQEHNENIVAEDFMVGDRYVGDKGKRPQSGRYAYKKRVKPTKV